MPRAFAPSVVTANDLLRGDVVYMDAGGAWVRDLARAEILTDEADAQLRLLDAQRDSGAVVGAYLAEMHPTGAGPRPAHFREAFRAKGPSNYAHGKQHA
jgi:hypothetical protein